MSADALLKAHDPVQVAMMEEEVILVDPEDNVLGKASKKETHLMVNINKGMLHRAFSVFLFNSKGELLLQQRASSKITFPDYWTNTCCSHPLHIPSELIPENQTGVRNAAIRKLEQELGIPTTALSPSDFTYLTRLHYKAGSDEKWGEHEVDYILFVQKDVPLKPNPDEVRDVKYFTADQLKEFLKTPGLVFTPWFKLIVENFIYKWWGDLKNLKQYVDEKTVHHL